MKNPRTGTDAQPRFLGAGSTVAAGDEDALEVLSRWITSPQNALFARVQVNRAWFQFMGRGLVDPPDDFRATNPASHPGLLDELAADFVRHKFDLRWLIGLIMNSRTYQLSSTPNESNEHDQITGS